MEALGVERPNITNWRLPSMREVAIGLLGGLAFCLLAYASITFTRGEDRIAAVWIPNAVAVAFLLRARLSNQALFIAMLWLGNIGANLLVGDVMAKAGWLASCNSLEIVLALVLTRRFCNRSPDMQNLADLTRFVSVAALAAPMVTAVPAAAMLAGFSGEFAASWAKWAVTDGLGMAIVAPTLLILATHGRGVAIPPSTK